ncbi:hypothetical protein [Candidatus Frankia alpina]|uniref:hypothetical protein n=1 Tax=Candidatus Frankia alpina TaxID=2699483 RepID=UPI001F194E6D|nr:hypothetical protein [Candidatus Frankia alpina]
MAPVVSWSTGRGPSAVTGRRTWRPAPGWPWPAGVGTPARIARRDTVFFGGTKPALVRQLAHRPVPPGHLLVFVFDIERSDLAGQLASLHGTGWCATQDWNFRLTGALTRYDRCVPGARPPRRVIVAYH